MKNKIKKQAEKLDISSNKLLLSGVSGSKLDLDAEFTPSKEISCKKCRYYHSTSDNVCIQNCEKLGLVGYYR